jgi:hypothetical protein
VVAVLGAALLVGLGFAGGLVAGNGSDAAAANRPRPAKHPAAHHQPNVLVYGDSLTVQASPYLTAVSQQFGLNMTAQAFAGLAPCDFLSFLRKDLRHRHPDLVVFAFSGNSVETCMLDPSGQPLRGLPMLAKYRADTETAADLATAARVPFVVVSPPASRGKEDVWKELDTIYRNIAATHVGVQYVDGGQNIAPGGVFTPTQQCLPFELKIPQAQGVCQSTESTIPVRGPDGGHFCGNTASTDAVLCPTYASGAMRYAVNLVTAAKLMVDTPATRQGL